MKHSTRALLWLFVCVCPFQSALRLVLKTPGKNESLRLHKARHAAGAASGALSGSFSENASVEDTHQEEINTISHELDELRDSRFFTHPGATLGPVQTVWIVGLGRSGTTLLQNLIVSAAVGQGVSVFASFEPCHSRDVFKDSKVGHRRYAAAKCMEQALRCNFSALEKKVHVNKTRHQVGRDQLPIHPDGVGDICAASQVRVFKTIYPVPTSFWMIQKWMDLPAHVQIIAISRDPRSIFSSVLDTPGFKKVTEHYTAPKICNTELQWVPEWQNVTLKGQLLPIKFESLVTMHNWEQRRLLRYLGWHKSPQLDHFIRTHMSAPDCAGYNQRYGYDFGTCRTPQDTIDVITKWKRKLLPRQKAMFTKGSCLQAIPKFGYLSKFWGKLYK